MPDTLAALPEQDQPTEALPPELPHEQLLRWIDEPNIADELDDGLLNQIGMRVTREYDLDENSRADWKTRTEEALKLAAQVTQEKSYPWPKAANVIFPLMTNAAIQFAARAYPAVVSGKEVAKGSVTGDDDGIPSLNAQGEPMPNPQAPGQPLWQIPPGAKAERATRIGRHMSWQLLDEQPEWEPDTDRLLHILPIVGCEFRKSYFDPAKGRNVSTRVSALNVVMNYHAKSIDTVPRVTEILELYPIEVEENERAGIFVPMTLGPAPDGDGDDDAPHKYLEQHRWLDLDEDGYPEPYIVTVHKESSRVARIRARYDADTIFYRNPQMPGELFSAADMLKLKLPSQAYEESRIARIAPIQYYTQYDFLPNTEGGIYGMGFGHLLKPLNEAVNTSLNQLLDAGTLANTGGGLIGKGLSLSAGAMRFQPGEYKTVNAAGGTIRDNVFPFPWAGPSPVLFQLLGLLIEAGKEVASIKDVLAGDAPNANVPATTTMALIEQGLKTFTAIYKRVYRALKSELAKLYRLNRIYLPQEGQKFRRGDQQFKVSREDYADDMSVEPIADPRMVSDMQQASMAQFLMTLANEPGINRIVALKRALALLQVDRPEELVMAQMPPNPVLVAKAAEMTARAHEIEIHSQEQRSDAARQKAAEIRDLAQGILYLAQADKAVGEGKLGWINAQLDIFRANLEALNGTGTGQDGTGDNGAGLSAVAPPPGVGGGPAVPPGLPPGAPPAAPPGVGGGPA